MKPSHRQRSIRSFWTRLRALGYGSYPEYLASEHWQDVQRRFWASRLAERCAGCKGRPTQIHHRTYKRLGQEWLNDLVAVCRDCHVAIHAVEQEHRSIKGGLRMVTKKALRRASPPR